MPIILREEEKNRTTHCKNKYICTYSAKHEEIASINDSVAKKQYISDNSNL